MDEATKILLESIDRKVDKIFRLLEKQNNRTRKLEIKVGGIFYVFGFIVVVAGIAKLFS